MPVDHRTTEDRLRSLEAQVKAQGQILEAMSLGMKGVLEQHAKGVLELANAVPSAVDQATSGLKPYDREAVWGEGPDVEQHRVTIALRRVMAVLSHNTVITRGELGRKLKAMRGEEKVTNNEINAALDVIANEGRLEVTKTPTGPSGRGRPVETYRLLAKAAS
jgi:hypothetical protein